jgi:cbb3-type cytochrome c oxidase subunit III
VSVVAFASCQPKGQEPAVDASADSKAVADSLAKVAQFERGGKAFIAYCAMCHGDGGNGDGDMSASLAQTGVKVARLNDLYMMGRLTPEQVREVIKKGGAHTNRSNVMPSWGNKLKPDAIEDITAFVVALPANNPAIPLATLEHFMTAREGVPADGRKLFVRHCASCHGFEGRGDGPTAAVLKEEHQVTVRDLADSAYMATRTDKELFSVVTLGGGHFKKAVYMPAWTVTLSPAQIKDVVAYLRDISHTPSKP